MEMNKLMIVCAAVMMISVCGTTENVYAKCKRVRATSKVKVVRSMDFAGGKYAGETDAKNLPHGKGKTLKNDGTIYEGNFLHGEPHGKGKRTFADGDVYEGDFLHGEPDGKGKQTFADGDIYEGDFARGKPHGKGKWKYKNGDAYEGNFVNGKIGAPELGSL
ncbi:hypothetical protein FACS189449_10040 [Alphaproteobacteria bacterium]|nr:hypothetical protein FACS189449_10040 [Alphaproteobacteria bacterium]